MFSIQAFDIIKQIRFLSRNFSECHSEISSIIFPKLLFFICITGFKNILPGYSYYMSNAEYHYMDRLLHKADRDGKFYICLIDSDVVQWAI